MRQEKGKQEQAWRSRESSTPTKRQAKSRRYGWVARPPRLSRPSRVLPPFFFSLIRDIQLPRVEKKIRLRVEPLHISFSPLLADLDPTSEIPMQALRAIVLFCALAQAAAFSVNAAAARTASRSAIATMQFGTGNFDDSKTEGFFLSPIPGQAKVRSTLSPCLNQPLRHA